MRTISILTLLVAAFLFAGCGDNLGFTYSSLNQRLAISVDEGGVPSVSEDGAAEIEGDAETDQPYVGPNPVPPNPVTRDPDPENSEEDDDDNDGISDEEDDLPNVCTKMVVQTGGEVSSAEIFLNDEEVFSENEFQNKKTEQLEKSVNLSSGANTLYVRLKSGKAGDQLLIQIYNCSTDPSALLYELVVTRTRGAPAESTGSF